MVLAINCHLNCQLSIEGGLLLKGYIEDRVIELANYIIEKKTTVRAAAKKFGISKSTVHTVVN